MSSPNTAYASPVFSPDSTVPSPAAETWETRSGVLQGGGGSPRSDRRVRTPGSNGSPRNRMGHVQGPPTSHGGGYFNNRE